MASNRPASARPVASPQNPTSEGSSITPSTIHRAADAEPTAAISTTSSGSSTVHPQSGLAPSTLPSFTGADQSVPTSLPQVDGIPNPNVDVDVSRQPLTQSSTQDPSRAIASTGSSLGAHRSTPEQHRVDGPQAPSQEVETQLETLDTRPVPQLPPKMQSTTDTAAQPPSSQMSPTVLPQPASGSASGFPVQSPSQATPRARTHDRHQSQEPLIPSVPESKKRGQTKETSAESVCALSHLSSSPHLGCDPRTLIILHHHIHRRPFDGPPHILCQECDSGPIRLQVSPRIKSATTQSSMSVG